MHPYQLQQRTTSGIWKGVDLSKITPEMVNASPNIDGVTNLVELAILSNTFSKFPKELITPKSLISLNGRMETTLHIAADKKQLKYIPKHLFNKKNLAKPNGAAGSTPMHYAAQHGCLDQIPKKFLIDKLLTIENKIGLSCLHFAVSALQYTETYKRPDLDYKHMVSQIKLIVDNLSNDSLKYYITQELDQLDHRGQPRITIKDQVPYSLITKELSKRKVLEYISKERQNIEI